MTIPAPLLRYVPDLPLPAYSFVPGHSPHPFSDPRGHSYQRPGDRPARPDAKRWADCRTYLIALDLFNHGYYWEAHETWEGLWHAAGRHGFLADFFKALIQLAVAGVKVRQGQPEGARWHVCRAADLLQHVADGEPQELTCMGLVLADLIVAARHIAANVPMTVDPTLPVEIVLPLVLQPSQTPGA
jgi:hypothetical protein